MKISKEKAAENRQRILDEAARLFREKGVHGVGVDALGEAAGLTHGSLYSQFGSKDQLLVEAIDRAFTSFGEKYNTVQDLATYVRNYLSAKHRANPGTGCTVAALGSEIPRQSKAVRRVFTEAVKRSIARVAALLPKDQTRAREDNAMAVIAMLAGGMILARAVDDERLSDRILSACSAKLQEGH